MATTELQDHYETLQVSKNADTDTIQRVFRLLAQRYHPDNQETGSEEQFRQIHEAYLGTERSRKAREVRHPSRNIPARTMEVRGAWLA